MNSQVNQNKLQGQTGLDESHSNLNMSMNLNDTDRNVILSMLQVFDRLTPDQIVAFTVEPAVKMALFSLIAHNVDSSAKNLE